MRLAVKYIAVLVTKENSAFGRFSFVNVVRKPEVTRQSLYKIN
jgi:hypothetical protein